MPVYHKKMITDINNAARRFLADPSRDNLQLLFMMPCTEHCTGCLAHDPGNRCLLNASVWSEHHITIAAEIQNYQDTYRFKFRAMSNVEADAMVSRIYLSFLEQAAKHDSQSQVLDNKGDG